MQSCAGVLVKMLEDYGVDIIFGIPGVHTVELYRGLHGSKIRHITARHEQGAGFMADGYARVTGKPGVCFLITGPGVTNAATALAEAFSDSVPILAISSVNPASQLGMGYGRLHELPSQRNLTSAFTLFSHTVLAAAELPQVLARAFACFSSGRPGPVHIEIPIDVLEQQMEYFRPNVQPVPRPGAIPESLQQAGQLLTSAQRPLLILGGGAVDAAVEATRFVDSLHCPVVTTTAGKGIVSEQHPLSLGASLPFAPVQALIAEADVVIAVGTEFSETDYLYTGEFPVIKGKLIRIDIDAQQLVRTFAPDVALLADAAQALAALHTRLTVGNAGGSGFSAQRVQHIRDSFAQCWLPNAWQHQKLLDALLKTLPDDAIIACDSTQLAYTACHYYPSLAPRKWFFPLGFGTLGYALPAALGMKLAAPGSQVVALVGDGGLLFTLPELATAAEYKLPVTLIVWNNNGYGEIRDAMHKANVTPLGVDLQVPDFVKLAEGFLCKGYRPDSLEEFAAALQEAKTATTPTLIEVMENAEFLLEGQS